MYILALTCQYPAGQGTRPCGDGARAGRTRAGRPGNAPEAGRPLSCRQGGVTGRTGPFTPMAPARRPARRAGSIWRVSESFPELAQAVLEHAQPDRIDIVRAKRHLLGQLGDGQPRPIGTLIASVATPLGAERPGRPQIALPSRDSVKTVITADHPIPAAIRADLTAREALAEMTADGMLIAAGSGTLGGGDEITLSFRLP
jgi:hypothetical protein